VVAPLDLALAERLAVVWTQEKRCYTPGWQHTEPLTDAELWHVQLGYGYEPAVTLRTSWLVGVESDGPEDREIAKPLLNRIGAQPLWIETRPDKPGRAHVYFRAPRELRPDEDVSFRFEGGDVTGATNNYYRIFGGDYVLAEYNPDALPMSEAQYLQLVEHERGSAKRQASALRSGEGLSEGSRRCTAFRLACMLFRWSEDEDLVVELVDIWQQASCEPELSYQQVAQQVRGAYRIADREGQLTCDLDALRTDKRRELTAQRWITAVARLTEALCSKWVEPKLADELVRHWYANEKGSA
jgi:hypothetical protein